MRIIGPNGVGKSTVLKRDWFVDSLIVFILSLGLYTITLAPTVLWGDEGHLQLQAVTGHLQASAGSHPIWVIIAHLFTRIPVGDTAGRINFVSALFASITLQFVYLMIRGMGINRWAAISGTLSLMISHTFWSYAVRAEVYTMTLAVMITVIWLGLQWYHTGQDRYLIAAGLLLGLGLAVHLVVILYVSALLWIVWTKRERLNRKILFLSFIAVGTGSLPLMGLVLRDAAILGMNWKQAIEWALFSFEGYSFRDALLDFSLLHFPADVFQWLAFLILQFVGIGVVAGVAGGIKSKSLIGRDKAILVLLLYVVSVTFAFPYRVGDRYVFYLPSYLPFTVWVACGFQWFEGKYGQRFDRTFPRWAKIVLIGLLLVVPVITYRLGPELVSRGITFRELRHVPGPRGKYFFLWPPKTGYDDPRRYAEEVFRALPEGTLLLAEPILASPLQFLQITEGQRPDVVIRYCCWDFQQICAEAGERPLAVTDLYPNIYPVDWIRKNFEIIPIGPVYLLIPLSPSQGG